MFVKVQDKKLVIAQQIMEETRLNPQQVCYIGDDLPDLALIRYCGVGVAAADACHDVREHADHVTELPGGHGAVRELIEMILKAQHRWDDLIRKFEGA